MLYIMFLIDYFELIFGTVVDDADTVSGWRVGIVIAAGERGDRVKTNAGNGTAARRILHISTVNLDVRSTFVAVHGARGGLAVVIIRSDTTGADT